MALEVELRVKENNQQVSGLKSSEGYYTNDWSRFAS
jgi:hypothetical protein